MTSRAASKSCRAAASACLAAAASSRAACDPAYMAEMREGKEGADIERLMPAQQQVFCECRA